MESLGEKRHKARLTLLVPMELKDDLMGMDFEIILEKLQAIAEQELNIFSRIPVDVEVIMSFGWFTSRE